ncbi:hypothetical protein [Cellulomonas sp. URHB0016]
MSSKRAVTAAAAGAAAVVAARTITEHRRRAVDEADLHRWRVVTVNRRIDEVGGTTPQPLASLGDEVEVQACAAPGDKGVELRARWRDGARPTTDDDPLRLLRTALRESKQQLEVGWVLEPDHNVTTQETPWNAPLRASVKVARGEGLL